MFTLQSDLHKFEAWMAMHDMREQGLFCDVILVAQDGVRLKAHKVVLAAMSMTLKGRMLQPEKSVQRWAVNLHHVHVANGNTLKKVLDFMYTGKVQCDDITELDDIHHASQELLITELEHVCDQLKHTDPILVGYYKNLKPTQSSSLENPSDSPLKVNHPRIVKVTLPFSNSGGSPFEGVPAQYTPQVGDVMKTVTVSLPEKTPTKDSAPKAGSTPLEIAPLVKVEPSDVQYEKKQEGTDVDVKEEKPDSPSGLPGADVKPSYENDVSMTDVAEEGTVSKSDGLALLSEFAATRTQQQSKSGNSSLGTSVGRPVVTKLSFADHQVDGMSAVMQPGSVYENKVQKLSSELLSKYKPVSLPRDGPPTTRVILPTHRAGYPTSVPVVINRPRVPAGPPARIVVLNRAPLPVRVMTTAPPQLTKIRTPSLTQVQGFPSLKVNGQQMVIRHQNIISSAPMVRPTATIQAAAGTLQGAVKISQGITQGMPPVVRHVPSAVPALTPPPDMGPSTSSSDSASAPVVSSTRKDVVSEFIANLRQKHLPATVDGFSEDESDGNEDWEFTDAPVIEGIFFEDSDSEYQMVDDDVMKIDQSNPQKKGKGFLSWSQESGDSGHHSTEDVADISPLQIKPSCVKFYEGQQPGSSRTPNILRKKTGVESTNARPFECRLCKMVFPTLQDWNKHTDMGSDHQMAIPSEHVLAYKSIKELNQMLLNGNFSADEIRALKRKRRRLKNRIYSSRSRASAESGFKTLLFEVETLRGERRMLLTESQKLEQELNKIKFMVKSLEEQIEQDQQNQT